MIVKVLIESSYDEVTSGRESILKLRKFAVVRESVSNICDIVVQLIVNSNKSPATITRGKTILFTCATARTFGCASVLAKSGSAAYVNHGAIIFTRSVTKATFAVIFLAFQDLIFRFV